MKARQQIKSNKNPSKLALSMIAPPQKQKRKEKRKHQKRTFK